MCSYLETSHGLGHTTIKWWFGKHGNGMATIQGGMTANSLGNCFVPEIFGQQAVCHFKQWPVSSDPGWKSKLLIYKSQHGGMPIITLFPGHFLYSEQ